MSDKGNSVDAVSLELFRSGLTAIAEEMGVVLTRSSYSPNIKERRDVSCALFDVRGRRRHIFRCIWGRCRTQ